MKAAVLKDVGKLSIEEMDVPACPDGGLLIEVKACAICGTDLKCARHGHRLIQFPRVIGHEVSGIVREVGSAVSGYAAGDRVVVAPAVPCGQCFYCWRGMQSMCDSLTAIGYHYDGGFAEMMAVPPSAVRAGCVNLIPGGVSFEEAAIAEPLACCINAEEITPVRTGSAVVVIGAGAVGCYHVMLACSRGAGRVILIDISAQRLEMARFAGADLSIDASKSDVVSMVLEETGGRGADLVITACSSGKAQEQGLAMVAKRGAVNLFGGLPKGDSVIAFDSNLPHYREFMVAGTHGSAPRHNKLALELIASGRVPAGRLVTHRLALEELPRGMEILEKGEGLKVIIQGKS